MTRRFQPSFVGGLFIGIVSSLPIVGGANACCCLWVVLGGLLTVYLQRQAHIEALDAAEAVLGGLVAGLVGALISTALSALLYAVSGDQVLQQIRGVLDGNAQVPPEIRDRVESLLGARNAPVMIGLISALVTVPMYSVFGMLGALLGLALFGKKPKPETPT